MTRSKGSRARLSSLLVVALGALSIFVLPGLASARNSSDDDGTSAATIKSFDQTTKTLVVALPDGTVSGLVTRGTKIRCEDQHRHGRGDHRIRGREAEPGDDRGGRGDEPGDDNGSGANCTTADLIPGAAVEEIDLDFGRGTVSFDEVELSHFS